MAQASKRSAKPKHIPQRTCVACRRSDAKRGLLRVVRDAEGRVALDPSGKRNGRGAYLCHDPLCWQNAVKRRSLERALRVEQLHPDDRASLLAFAATLPPAENPPDPRTPEVVPPDVHSLDPATPSGVGPGAQGEKGNKTDATER